MLLILPKLAKTFLLRKPEVSRLKFMREETYGDFAGQEDVFQQARHYLTKLLKKWYWLVGSLFITLAIAYYITSQADRVYRVTSSILVKGPEGMNNTVTDILYGDELPKRTNSPIENETFLIKRFDLVRSTLETLNFGAIVYGKHSPINVYIDSANNYTPDGAAFYCHINSRQMFTLSTENEDLIGLVEGQVYEFGERIDLDGFIFTVELDPSKYNDYQQSAEEGEEPEPVLFEINDLDRMADRYIAMIQVEPVGELASILELSIESPWPSRERKFLDELTENFVVSGLREKVATATQTVNFIDSQLSFISDSLNSIENVRENFKENRTIDLSKEGTELYNEIQSLEKEKAEHLVQKEYLQYLSNYVRDDQNDFEYITVPSSLGISDAVLNSLIDQLITEQIKLKQVKTGAKIENPRVKLARQKIVNLRKTIEETSSNLLKGNRIARNELERRIGKYSENLGSLPEAERRLINIERQYNLSESLYNFLMEKRTEAGILRASTVPDYKIVNRARLDNGGRPIAPKPAINYAAAVVLGLLIPIAFFYVEDKMSNKVYTPEEVITLTKVPLLGMVGKFDSPGKLVDEEPRSAVAEAFRGIRSNLRYMTDSSQQGKTFMVSSFVSGEGKTFCAKNLAYVFSLAGKKTVYVNTDLRKNNTYSEFGLKKTTGLTEYLIDVVPMEAVIHPTHHENLHIVTGGQVPPNPSELLMNERFGALLRYLKEHYTYIILDTPPRGIISDAMELIKYADVEIFVVRQGFTTKQNLAALDQINARNKDRHPSGIILNDVDFKKLEYGGMGKKAFTYNYMVEG